MALSPTYSTPAPVPYTRMMGCEAKEKGFLIVPGASMRTGFCPATLHLWGLQWKVSFIFAALCLVTSNSTASLHTAIRKKSGL